MFAWHEDQQQAGDAIWADFSEGEEHTGPYPMGVEDSTSVSVEDHKNNDEEGAIVGGITKHSTAAQSVLHQLEKQAINQTNAHFSSTPLDMESWPDLPSLNPTLDRNYCDDNIASTYLDLSAEPSLQKVTGNTTVQLDGDPPEVCDNDHEEKSNSFLDCDWGNIGDFDDFDRLFSSSDSIFGNEIVANGSDFLSSSDFMDSIEQSIPTSLVPLDKQPSSDCGPSLFVNNEISAGINKQENKVADANAKSGEQSESKCNLTCEYSGKQNQLSQEGDVQKRQGRSQRKLDESGKSKISSNTSGFSQRKKPNPPSSLQAPMQPVQTQSALFNDGKNTGQVQHPNQFMFPSYGYPAYPFPTIPLVSGIQAEGHQTKPAATSYRTSTDTEKHSNSTEKSQDIPSRPVTMTPQEKIEKLRRRQQMQALIAIQQQQQQFGQVGSGSDTIVPQTYSPGNKNPDSFGSSIVIDENTNNVFSPELIPSNHEEFHKSSKVSDDPFIEEKIYYQLQDALGKLEARTRLCIRDSLLRLAHSATKRQSAVDRSSSNKTNKDEDEASENDTSSRRKRSPMEAETNTNPIDRIVAHLLFHRHGSKVATTKKEEIISTSLTLEPGSKLPAETLRVLEQEPDPKLPAETLRVQSEDQQFEQETVVQPSQ